VLLVFSAGVYSMLATGLRLQLDAQLRSAVEVTTLALNHEIEEHGGRGPGEASVRLVLTTMHQTSFPQLAIGIWDGARLVAEKAGQAGLRPGDIHPQIAQAGGLSYSTGERSGIRYRSAAVQARVPFIDASYQVVANQTLREIDAELESLRGTFYLAVPVSLLLAAAGGYFLARKSLAPVLAIARTAESISSRNLDQRMTVHNPADELGMLAQTFNRLLERLQVTFRQQQQFMSDASHELRTPLSIALTSAQVTLNSHTRSIEELTSSLSLIEEQLKRLKRIVEDMFTLAQADAGGVQMNRDVFYLDELLDETVRAAAVLGASKGVDVRADLHVRDATFEGDEDLIRQLLLIVLENAVKYNHGGGSVQAALAAEEGSYRIRISDTGPGIAPADQRHIFDRFYRQDKARSRRDTLHGSGAGLGLAIARWIAEMHGATIQLERSGPEGSVFAIWFPQSSSIANRLNGVSV
jgi:heavy metal sensor kinase